MKDAMCDVLTSAGECLCILATFGLLALLWLVL